jgi:hypothetical protein
MTKREKRSAAKVEGRKQAVSLRVSAADLRKVKMLARRLGARDSDIIRFAVKTMLARLAPLCDQSLHGRALLPVFIEAGSDFFHHFDLDTARLIEIINDGVNKAQEVEPDDLKLVAMAGLQQAYAELRLNKMTPTLGNERLATTEAPLSGRLRGYLYSKYVDKEPSSDAAND